MIVPDPFPGWGTLGGEKMDRGKLTSDPGFGEPSTTAPDRITMVESPRPDESADCCPECGGYVFNPEVNPGGASTITTASPTAQS